MVDWLVQMYIFVQFCMVWESKSILYSSHRNGSVHYKLSFHGIAAQAWVPRPYKDVHSYKPVEYTWHRSDYQVSRCVCHLQCSVIS